MCFAYLTLEVLTEHCAMANRTHCLLVSGEYRPEVFYSLFCFSEITYSLLIYYFAL